MHFHTIPYLPLRRLTRVRSLTLDEHTFFEDWHMRIVPDRLALFGASQPRQWRNQSKCPERNDRGIPRARTSVLLTFGNLGNTCPPSRRGAGALIFPPRAGRPNEVRSECNLRRLPIRTPVTPEWPQCHTDIMSVTPSVARRAYLMRPALNSDVFLMCGGSLCRRAGPTSMFL